MNLLCPVYQKLTYYIGRDRQSDIHANGCNHNYYHTALRLVTIIIVIIIAVSVCRHCKKFCCHREIVQCFILLRNIFTHSKPPEVGSLLQ